MIPACNARRRMVSTVLLCAMLGFGPARAAESYTLKDLSVDDGQVHLSAPEMTLAGAGLARADLEALAKAGKSADLLNRLIAGGVDSLSAPQVTIEIRRPDPANAGGSRSRTSFKGLQVKGLKSGVAASLSAESLSATMDRGVEMKTGPLSVSQAGLGALAGLALGQGVGEGYVLLAGEGRLQAIDMIRPASSSSAEVLTVKGLSIRGGKSTQGLFPALGSVELSGLKGSRSDVPVGAKQNWTMASLRLNAEEATASTPGRFAASASRLAVATGPDGSKDLAELGYAPLLLAAALEGGWDATRQELAIDRLSVSGESFGGITFAALLGNVTRAALEGTEGRKMLADATIKWMSVVVEDLGLFERLVKRQAKATAVSETQARNRMTAQAQMIAAMMLGEQARSPLGEAVNRFLAAPGRLSVRSESKSAAGVPLSDLTRKGGSEPAIAGQFTVTAEVR